MYYEQETKETYQEKLKQLKQLGLTDDQIASVCSSILSICAIGLDDPTTMQYRYLASLLPVSINEDHSFSSIETEAFESFADCYLSAYNEAYEDNENVSFDIVEAKPEFTIVEAKPPF